MKTKLILIAAAILSFWGCDVMKQAAGAYNLTQCKYEYNSISKLTLSGIDLSNGVSLLQVPQAISALSGKSSSIPLNFTLNLDVSNPNQAAAMFNGLDYILSIDDVQFTTGSVNQSLDIPAGGKQMLPLTIGVDLATLLKGDSKNAVSNIAKNFIGIGDQKSKVTIQIRPTLLFGTQKVVSPVYIPVSFSFGGAKK